MKRHSNNGQATVEFALILPMFVACIVLIFSVLSACLQVLSLNDFARSAVRIAVTADEPEQAIQAIPRPLRTHVTVKEDAKGIITVSASQSFRLWFLTISIAQLHLRASSSMMREPPVVLG